MLVTEIDSYLTTTVLLYLVIVASALSNISFEEEKEINVMELNIQGDDISKCHQRFLLNGVRWVLKHKDAIETESLLEYVPRGKC